jgi:transcriptional regulator with GAF, ATPase, and Fis domain
VPQKPIFSLKTTLREERDDTERDIVLRALATVGGNRVKAAKFLESIDRDYIKNLKI